MNRLLNLFKQPIYQDDLKRVLMYGSLNMLAFGVLAGALQFFANSYLGIGFSLLIYLIAFMIGKEIRERTFNYHILYSVLSVVFFIVGYVIYKISYYSFLTHDPILSLQFIFSSHGFKAAVLPFLNLSSYTGIYAFNNVLDILILVFCIVTAWNFPKYSK